MSLFDRFKRREQRAAVKSDDPYLGEFFGLRGGIGGYVDPGRASGIAVAHACIAIVSQNLAAMPLNLYRRADNGGRDRATDHPLYTVLHDMANPTMTAYEAREALITVRPNLRACVTAHSKPIAALSNGSARPMASA